MPSPVIDEIVKTRHLVDRGVALDPTITLGRSNSRPGITELAQQDVELFLGRHRRELREVEQHAQDPRAFDVTQEVVPESAALGRAFDQSGNVGHDELRGVTRAPLRSPTRTTPRFGTSVVKG